MLGRETHELANVTVVQPNFDIAESRQYNQPPIFAVDLQISDNCNQACPNCWGPTHHRRPASQPAELRSTEEWQALLHDIDAYAAATYRQEADNVTVQAPDPRIIFTGAEPLRSDRFIPSLRTAKLLPHLGKITVSSNCVTDSLVTAERFEQAIGLLTPYKDELAAPVEGSTDAIVELVRPGSTAIGAREYALAAGRRAQEQNVLFKPRTVVTPGRNEADLRYIPASMRAAGIDLAKVVKWKCGQPQPPASRYEQTANWPGADAWEKEWGISAERVLSAAIGAALLYPELRTDVQLYRNTTGRYNLQVDPYGVAYTLIINHEGMPREVAFGDILSDFNGVMERYKLFYSLSYGMQRITEGILSNPSSGSLDPDNRTHVLSALLAEGCETVTPGWLANFDRPPYANQSLPRRPSKSTAPACIEITGSAPSSPIAPLTKEQWHTTLADLVDRGMERIALGAGWDQESACDALLEAVASLPHVPLEAFVYAGSDKLRELMNTRRVDRLRIPFEISSPLNGGRLELVTQQILGAGQSQAIELLQTAIERGQKITVQVGVDEGNINLIPQLGSILQAVGGPESTTATVELVEQAPLQHWNKEHKGFEHDGLATIAEKLRALGYLQTQVIAWAHQPSNRFLIDAHGRALSQEIGTDGIVRPFVYGHIGCHSVADILTQRRRHARSVADRQRQITHIDMPHGYKSSVLEEAVNNPMAIITSADRQNMQEGQEGSDALARYYYGKPVLRRAAGLLLAR